LRLILATNCDWSSERIAEDLDATLLLRPRRIASGRSECNRSDLDVASDGRLRLGLDRSRSGGRRLGSGLTNGSFPGLLIEIQIDIKRLIDDGRALSSSRRLVDVGADIIIIRWTFRATLARAMIIVVFDAGGCVLVRLRRLSLLAIGWDSHL
jgi:hypothetical protein